MHGEYPSHMIGLVQGEFSIEVNEVNLPADTISSSQPKVNLPSSKPAGYVPPELRKGYRHPKTR